MYRYVGHYVEPVRRSGELPPLVGRTRPGTTAQTGIIREGEEKTLEVAIEELPEEALGAPEEPAQAPTSRLGVQVEPAPPGADGEQGILVSGVQPGSAAARAGVQPGDLLLRLGATTLTDVEQFRQLVDELPAGEPVPVLIRREGTPLFLTLTLPE